MTFCARDGGLLKVNKQPLDIMLSYKQNISAKPEAGGVLLGRFILNSRNVIIDEITTPTAKDKSTRVYFLRDADSHQELITSAWQRSGGTCNYLGEWHTHPEPVPSPSRQDIRNWKNILKNGIYSSNRLFFAIVGYQRTNIWIGHRKGLQIEQLLFHGKK